MLQTIVNLCAVAGFLLSIFGLLQSLYHRRRALRVPSLTLFESPKDVRPLVAVRILISNLSDCPVSICDIQLCLGAECIAPLPVPARIFHYQNHGTGTSQDIFATRFPVHLSALESKEIFAVYPSRYNSVLQFQSALLQQDRLGREYIRCCLQTSRGKCAIRIRDFQMLAADSVFDILKANCRS